MKLNYKVHWPNNTEIFALFKSKGAMEMARMFSVSPGMIYQKLGVIPEYEELQSHRNFGNKIVNWPTDEGLLQRIARSSMRKVAKELDVSVNAVSLRIKKRIGNVDWKTLKVENTSK